ncbi:MAG: hypothetical protein NTW87_31140, partial [Planctomycetota bacterium]|nr:hypothetical protein [Planctomycetota bacterium]
LHRANASVLALGKVASAQETLLKEVSARYREGLESGANAARALAELRNAQRDLDQARTDYLAAWYELNAASLSDEALQADQAARQLDTTPPLLTPDAANRKKESAAPPAGEPAPRDGTERPR